MGASGAAWTPPAPAGTGSCPDIPPPQHSQQWGSSSLQGGPSSGTLPQPLPDHASSAAAASRILCRSCRRICARTRDGLCHSTPHQSPPPTPSPSPRVPKSDPPAHGHVPSIRPAGAQSKATPHWRHRTVSAPKRDPRKTAPKLPPSAPAGWLQLGRSWSRGQPRQQHWWQWIFKN